MQQVQDSFFVDMKSSDPLLDLPTYLEYYLQCLKVEIRIRTELVGHLLKEEHIIGFPNGNVQYKVVLAYQFWSAKS